jgi:polysaccharide export outer membrane protein
MRNETNQRICFGLSLIVFAGSLWAQVPDARVPGASTSLAQSASKPHDGSFVIGNDDLLAINVWKEPDISRSIPVRSDGRISLPLVGEVQAAGRTPLQLERDISTKLLSYIAQPEVTVMVQEIHSQKFNILGQVTKPGSYPLEAATTVLDAIAAAGGFRDFANKKGIYILRQNSGGGQSRIAFDYKKVIKGKNAQQNIALQSRDTIVVP